MFENPYQSPDAAPDRMPAAPATSFTSTKIWFAVLLISSAAALAVVSVHHSLPRDRILPDRLDTNQSDLIHIALAVAFLISGTTAAVSGCALVVAIPRRRRTRTT